MYNDDYNYDHHYLIKVDHGKIAEHGRKPIQTVVDDGRHMKQYIVGVWHERVCLPQNNVDA